MLDRHLQPGTLLVTPTKTNEHQTNTQHQTGTPRHPNTYTAGSTSTPRPEIRPNLNNSQPLERSIAISYCCIICGLHMLSHRILTYRLAILKCHMLKKPQHTVHSSSARPYLLTCVLFPQQCHNNVSIMYKTNLSADKKTEYSKNIHRHNQTSEKVSCFHSLHTQVQQK